MKYVTLNLAKTHQYVRKIQPQPNVMAMHPIIVSGSNIKGPETNQCTLVDVQDLAKDSSGEKNYS